MEISIRKPREEDIPAIAEVNVACWRVAYRDIIDPDFMAGISTLGFASHFRERFSQGKVFIHVAETHNGEIAGFCTGGPNRGKSLDVFDSEVYSIYVHNDHQRHGLGKRLLHAVLSELMENGFSSVIIWTLKDNPYRRFYESLGGNVYKESTFEIGGKDYPTVGFVWNDIRELYSKTGV